MADLRVALHHRELFRRQSAGLEQDGIGDAELAHVVHRCGHQQGLGEGVSQAQAAGDQGRIVQHALDVGAGLGIAELGRTRQPGDGLALAVEDVGGRPAHLGGEGLGAVLVGEVGLAQLEHVAHARFKLARIDRLGEEVARAAVECRVAHVALVAGGDHQDGQVVAVAAGADAADEFQPVHLGHHVVDDDEVGRIGEAPLERGGGALEVVGTRILHAVDELADQEQVELRVVDHCDLHRTVEWEFHPMSIGGLGPRTEELLRGRHRIRASSVQSGRAMRPSVLNW